MSKIISWLLYILKIKNGVILVNLLYFFVNVNFIGIKVYKYELYYKSI